MERSTKPITLTPALFRPRVRPGSTRYTPRFATAHSADMAAATLPPIVEGETELRVVDGFKGWRELSRFRCGYSDKKAEAEIHMTAQKLAAGGHVELGTGVEGPLYERIVSLEAEGGELISWCAITRRHLCEVPAPCEPGGYIFAIATAYAYRGWRLDLRGTRPADAVMRRALEVMSDDLGGGEMPYVWARVLPDNRPSNRLFRDHRFRLFPRPWEGQAIRARPAGLDPGRTWLDETGDEHPLAA